MPSPHDVAQGTFANWWDTPASKLGVTNWYVNEEHSQDGRRLAAAEKHAKDLLAKDPNSRQKQIDLDYISARFRAFNLIHNGDDGFGGWLSNAVKSAGRAVSHVESGVTDEVGKIGNAIKSVPIVGAPIHGLFDLAYKEVTAPANILTAVASGKRIDRAVMSELSSAMQDVKAVGPFVQTVVSFVPGVGQGVAGALGAGLALAEGQPLSKALIDGIKGALPGGPVAKAAFDMAQAGITAAIQNKALDIASLGQSALGAATDVLGLPASAKDALMAGVTLAGHVAHGQPLDTALTQAAISAVPLPQEVKNAVSQASALSLDVAHGKPVDQAALGQLANISRVIPIGNVADIAKQAAGDKANAVLSSIQGAVSDTFIGHALQNAPKSVKDAVQTGMAVGHAGIVQAQRANQLLNVIPGKLQQSGIELAKSNPLFQEGRRMVDSVKGFDLASGLGSQSSKLFDITTLRNSLNGPDKAAFDTAMSLRIGAVAHPPPKGLSDHTAKAGYFITQGLQGQRPQNKVSIIQRVVKLPSARVGATLAVQHISDNRKGFWAWLKKVLGLSK